MTSSDRKVLTVTLTFRQIESILTDMGWEDEDVDTFWLLALHRNTGVRS